MIVLWTKKIHRYFWHFLMKKSHHKITSKTPIWTPKIKSNTTSCQIDYLYIKGRTWKLMYRSFSKMVCPWHLILTDKNHLTLFHHQFALSFFIITPFSKSTTNHDFRWNNPTSRKVFFCQHEAVESFFVSYANNVFVTYVNTFTQNIYVHGYEILTNTVTFA